VQNYFYEILRVSARSAGNQSYSPADLTDFRRFFGFKKHQIYFARLLKPHKGKNKNIIYNTLDMYLNKNYSKSKLVI
jgi:hypothetical protein